MPFLCTLVIRRKALVERRDQPVLKPWLLGKS
jgi:hypothetical protein